MTSSHPRSATQLRSHAPVYPLDHSLRLIDFEAAVTAKDHNVDGSGQKMLEEEMRLVMIWLGFHENVWNLL